MPLAKIAADREWKHYALLEFQSKANNADAPTGQFSGYASTWVKDAYGDMIQPGAFAQSIAGNKGKIPIFFNHDSDKWIGFSNTLAEDHKGLQLNAGLALKTSLGADIYQLLMAADEADFRVGMSIGFIPTEWDWDGDNRLLKQIDLMEVSITPFPANPRSFVDEVKTIRVYEKRLRAGGFSLKDSKRILDLLSSASSGGPDDRQGEPPERDVTERLPQTFVDLMRRHKQCPS